MTSFNLIPAKHLLNKLGLCRATIRHQPKQGYCLRASPMWALYSRVYVQKEAKSEVGQCYL